MSFSHVSNLLKQNFDKNVEKYGQLFTVELDRDELWGLYLGSFPEGTNPLYRTRTEHDCSCCRHFLKNIGPTVWIDDDLNLHTIFEFDTGHPNEYQPVMDALDAFVKKHAISGIYLNKENYVGTGMSVALYGAETVRFSHFNLVLPESMHCRGNSIGTMRGDFCTTKSVFMRSLREISIDAVDTVLELIASNSLYRGEEWKAQLEKFRGYKVKYDSLPEEKKDLFCLKWTSAAGNVIGKTRNHSIGVLLTDITNGVELDTAVRTYESIVAPANYKRPKAIFTKKMLEEARKKVEELGFIDSLPRRYATLDDISVGNILFANRDVRKKLTGNVFDELAEETVVNPKKFSTVEEVPIGKFISDVLPTVREVDVLMQPRLEKNLCSVIAPVNPEAKTMFKWNNGFSWAYSGNMTDSDIRTNVKKAGGRVDGVLRFSIQWNDGSDYDQNDEDAHCIEPSGNEIYYGNKVNRRTGGNLDVDIIHPISGTPAVENITWPADHMMEDGVYRFFVHCYSCRGGKSGFRAEIEFDGEVYRFDYAKPLRQGENVSVAEVTLHKGQFSIQEKLSANSSLSSREVWGVKENCFVPVSVIMYSPNYWDGQNGIGNRHYMFMMNGCVNPETPNGFYNEFLSNELLEHKRVFEALGEKMKVQDTENQLSGLGFSSTQHTELIVRVKGNTQRVIRIKI